MNIASKEEAEEVLQLKTQRQIMIRKTVPGPSKGLPDDTIGKNGEK